jgi:hypothetical protein
MKINEQVQGQRHPDKLQPGSVVYSWLNGSRSGPFLVCAENAHAPLDHNGCPNGQVRQFLVSLHNGERYNFSGLDDDCTFSVAHATLTVDAP